MEHIERLELFRQLIPGLKHCNLLGMSVEDIEPGRIVLKIPYSPEIVGNPDSGVIHGGVLTTLMDTACGFAAISALQEAAIAPTLDLRIDYMRPAIPEQPVFAQAEVYRTTRNVLFARGTAFQNEREYTVAHCSATFMCLEQEKIERKVDS